MAILTLGNDHDHAVLLRALERQTKSMEHFINKPPSNFEALLQSTLSTLREVNAPPNVVNFFQKRWPEIQIGIYSSSTGIGLITKGDRMRSFVPGKFLAKEKFFKDLRRAVDRGEIPVTGRAQISKQ